MNQLWTLSLNTRLYTWGLLLMVGIPLAILLLNELVDRLRRQESRLAGPVSNLRNLVLPLLSIRLILEHILGLDGALLVVRVVETLMWLVVIYSVVQLLGALVAAPRLAPGMAVVKTTDLRFPRVWSELLRLLILAGVLFYVLSNVWGVPVGQVFAVLGVGSIVIGFALQDTLSSLVSGLLLAFEKPFEVGHWMRYGPYEGQIIEMNWRAVRLRTRERDVVVIPNALLGKDTAINFTLIDPLHAELIRVSFPYDYSPNHIKQMLLETALATPGVVADPQPHIRITNYLYDKFAIEYEIKLFILDYYRTEFIRDEVLTRVYYAAQRQNLAVPYVTTIYYQRDSAELEPPDHYGEILQRLQAVPSFASLDSRILEALAHGAALHTYGVDELIVRQGTAFTGLYIVLAGRVHLIVQDRFDQPQTVATLGKGEIFGESLLLRNQPSPYTVVVAEDLHALFVRRATLIEVVETNPRLAMEMNRFVEQRQRLVERALTLTKLGEAQPVMVNGTGAKGKEA
jgi:small-conductance mechanosensitive channel/CRP-like cAMP-binding protein